MYVVQKIGKQYISKLQKNKFNKTVFFLWFFMLYLCRKVIIHLFFVKTETK